MMAQTFPPHAGMAPGGHPGIPHGHPMAGMQHPGAGHMGGQPAPGMMQGMHPGVSGPQVTQGPMVTGMPPGAGTPAPGPMHNGNMAMAHLGPQQAMFQQHNPQMNFGQMQMTPQQQSILARQRMIQLQQQSQGMPMGMPNGPPYNQAQLAQMKMGMGMHPQMQMNPNNPQMQNFQHQQQQQQRMMQAQQVQAAHHAAALAAAQNQRAAAQQMQMSRSQEQTTQPPQSQPTPAPQTQAPQPPPPPPTSQPPSQPSQPKPQQPQPPPANTPQQNQPSNPPVKTTEPEEEPQIKTQPDVAAPMLMPEFPKQDMIGGQCILQLISYQDNLANPERPHDLDYWEQLIARFFSPFGSLRQQFFSNKSNGDKFYQLQYPSLARYYHSYYAAGVKQIFLQSFDHNQSKLPNGNVHIWSTNTSLTYVFGNDIRVTTSGQLRVIFDEAQRIEHLNISSSGWQEYIPRIALLQPSSPETKQSPKITNKNVKRTQGKAGGPNAMPVIPTSGVGEWGVPQHISQFLEASCAPA